MAVNTVYVCIAGKQSIDDDDEGLVDQIRRAIRDDDSHNDQHKGHSA